MVIGGCSIRAIDTTMEGKMVVRWGFNEPGAPEKSTPAEGANMAEEGERENSNE
jgi:hypothetical protein